MDAVARAGEVDGPPEYHFRDVSAAVSRPDGSIVVADRGTGHVRVFDSNGVFVGTLGGPGSGPGEFQAPEDLRIEADGALSVWDGALWRTTVFGADGSLLEVQPPLLDALVAAGTPPVYPERAVFGTTGSLLVTLGEKAKSAPEGFSRPLGGLLRADSEGTAEHLLDLSGGEMVLIDSEFGQILVQPALSRRIVVAAQPGGNRSCAGDQSGPWVVCFQDGHPEAVIAWTEPDAVVTGAEAEVLEWEEATIRGFSLKSGASGAQDFVNATPRPDVRPPFRSITLSADGDLWVERTTERDSEFLVFDPTGKLLGSVVAPRMRLLEVGPDALLSVMADDLGVQRVRRFRLTKP